MKAAILGVTGYTGLILLRLLRNHPEVSDILAVSSSQAGASVRSLDPGLPADIVQKMAATGGKTAPMAEAVRRANPETSTWSSPRFRT